MGLTQRLPGSICERRTGLPSMCAGLRVAAVLGDVSHSGNRKGESCTVLLLLSQCNLETSSVYRLGFVGVR